MKENETKRLKCLRSYAILDTSPEPAFDDLTRLAAMICEAPIALVSLVDEHRLWFKSTLGIEARETERNHAFCAHTISGTTPLIIEDASLDSRFQRNSLVTGEPRIRFYAGIPLVTQDQHALGSLCVMDRKPRRLTRDQVDALSVLAKQVIAHLELGRLKEKERLLFEEQKKLEMITNHVGDVIWMTDPEKHKIIYISPGYERVWERSRQSLYETPMSFVDAIHPEDRPRVMKDLQTQAHGEYQSYYRIITPGGQIKWILDRAFPIRNAEGKIFRVVGIASDLTEKHSQERLIVEQKEKLETIVNHIPVMISFLSETGRIEWVNPEWSKVLGWSEKEIHEKNLMPEIFPDPKVLQEALDFIASPNKSGWTEFEVLSKSNKSIHTSWANVRLSSGKTIAIGTDISTRKQQEKLIQDQHLKIVASAKMSSLGEMAGGIAHEINNPLAIIHGAASQIETITKSGAFTPEKLIQHSEMIQKTTQRIAKIIRGLRSFARDGEKDPFQRVLVLQIISETLEFCRMRFSNHGVELRVAPECLEGALTIECRSVQISQVLLNLLNNAFDAVRNGKQSWVELGLRETPGHVEILVTDSGNGIPLELREKLMRPFFTTKEAGAGVGLGLSISLGIVASHLGSLSIDSSCANTRFVIRLPRHQNAAKEAA